MNQTLSDSGERAGTTAVDAANPWLGLASFTEETRAYFHGRDEEVGELGRRVQRKLLTVLFGQSGLGKTSILRAGIVPRLRPEGYCPVYVRIDYGRESPPPSEQIKQAVLRETVEAGTWTQTGSATAGESLWEFLHHRDDTLHDAKGRTLIPLLIFDQFEEVFTLAQSDDFGRERAQTFLKDLADLVENRPPVALEAKIEQNERLAEQFDFARSDYRILIALREDYLAHLEGLKTLMPSVTQNRMRLARMNGTQAIAAVTGPGRALVTDDVARAIVRFVSGAGDLATAEVEPSLLSLVCRELNNQRLAQGRSEISDELLAGSRETILTEFYERTIADQPPGVRAFVEDELLTDSGFRESIAEERVKKAFAASGGGAGSLATLVDRRLLRVEERLDVRRVELTHDVLCAVVKASRDARQERESKAAVERQLAATKQNELATRRALWRARLVASVCAVVALAAVGSAIFGYMSRQRAVTAERQAEAAAEEASAARKLADAGRAQAEGVMDYMLTDLREELTDIGHAPVLLEVSRKAVAYFQGLPGELMTVGTQVGKANALANLGAVLGVRGVTAEANTRFQEAIAIFESVERSGKMTPAMQVDYAWALGRWARNIASETNFDQTFPLLERAERLLQPPTTIGALRGPALRALAHILYGRGFSLLRTSRPDEATAYFRRSVIAAQEGDTLPPLPRRPGLQTATSLSRLATSLAGEDPPAARAAIDEAEARLMGFLKAEPYLASAKVSLTYVLAAKGRQQLHEWDFAAAERTQIRKLELFDELLTIDPQNRVFRNNRAVSYWNAWAEAGLPTEFWRGDFAGAEVALNKALAGLSVAEASNYMRLTRGLNHGKLAAVHAGVGRNAESQRHLAAMQASFAELAAMGGRLDAAAQGDQEIDSTGRDLESARRKVQMAALDWRAVRSGAEKSLAQLEKQKSSTLDGERTSTAQRAEANDLMVAAWATGDYPVARRAMSLVESGRKPLPAQPTAMQRYDEVVSQLERIHVLVRAGERPEARRRLDALWPEVEAVFARAPEEVFTQVEMARAGWVKAEVRDDLDRPARLELLERAAGLLRPLAAAGKLTRFNREVLLGGIEKQMEELRR